MDGLEVFGGKFSAAQIGRMCVFLLQRLWLSVRELNRCAELDNM